MMERSADAWEHNQFKEVVVKVANIEIYYKVGFDRSYTLQYSSLIFLHAFIGSNLLLARATYATQ